MKVLITGAFGGIGGDLSIFLSNYFKLRLSHWRKPENKIPYEFVAVDITKYEEVEKASSGVDAIVHLAAKGAKNPQSADPLETFSVNVMGTLNLLEAAIKNNVKKFIYASSVWVYGLPAEGFLPEYFPIDEDYPLKAKGAYSLSKVLAENLCKGYALKYGISVISLRIGEVMHRGHCYRECIKGRIDDVVRRTKDGLWNHVDIRDLGQVIKLALENDVLRYEVFNVTAEDTIISNIDSLDLIKKFFPEIKKIYNKNSFITRSNRSFFDITKAKELLDFRPKYSLEGYLKWLKEGKNEDEYYRI